MFNIDERLARDCCLVTELPLCELLMMNDSQYPWFILVPRVAGVTEIIDLSEAAQQQLWRESRALSKALQIDYAPDKLNVAALGNMVSQLHVHHIARYREDKAWPAPVWGAFPAQPYAQDEAEKRMTQTRQTVLAQLALLKPAGEGV